MPSRLLRSFISSRSAKSSKSSRSAKSSKSSSSAKLAPTNMTREHTLPPQEVEAYANEIEADVEKLYNKHKSYEELKIRLGILNNKLKQIQNEINMGKKSIQEFEKEIKILSKKHNIEKKFLEKYPEYRPPPKSKR